MTHPRTACSEGRSRRLLRGVNHIPKIPAGLRVLHTIVIWTFRSLMFRRGAVKSFILLGRSNAGCAF